MPAASTDAALHDDLTGPAGGLNAAAAEAVLTWRFSEPVLDRMRTLAAKHREGELAGDESEEFDRLRRVGLFADVMYAKARAALANRGRVAGN